MSKNKKMNIVNSSTKIFASTKLRTTLYELVAHRILRPVVKISEIFSSNYKEQSAYRV